MIGKPEDGLALWRVGYHADPLGFTPREIYEFSHRFDDFHRRFRTLYCAELAETCLREVLADFRPNLAAQRRHIERYGPEAAADFTPSAGNGAVAGAARPYSHGRTARRAFD